jgi:hypothetical protein
MLIDIMGWDVVMAAPVPVARAITPPAASAEEDNKDEVMAMEE